MKKINITIIKVAAVLVTGVLWQSSTQAQTIIDLSRPVGESITPNGVYYKFDDTFLGGKNNAFTMTTDSSGNNYHGYLENGANVDMPDLTDGVDLPNTTGFDDGLKLYTTSTAANDLNRAYAALPVTNNLAMVATDFTGGVWIRLDSISVGTQKIIIMDRGGMNYNAGVDGGHWTYFLDKDSDGNWLFGFQVGDGSAYVNGFHNDAYQNLNLQDGVWHHVAFTYDYIDGSDNVVTFWLDGVSIGSAQLDLNITAGSTDSTVRRFSVGDRATSGYSTTYFDGAIDDLFVTTGIYSFDYSAIPEPGSMVLLSLAFILLAGLSGRKRIAPKA